MVHEKPHLLFAALNTVATYITVRVAHCYSMSDLSDSNDGSNPPDDEKQGQNHQEQQHKVQDDDESGNNEPANNTASSGNGKHSASAAGVAMTARKR